jgi:TRAP-type C4-dicarboxylate transport system substrate-binding protein
MKIKLVSRLVWIVIALSAWTMLYPGIASAQKAVRLNYANFFPAPHKNSVLAEEWCREIEKRTNGAVKISYFPGGTLTPVAQTYDNVVMGIADIGLGVFSYNTGKFPLLEVIDLPLGYNDAIQATKLLNTFYAKFKPKELDDVKVLILSANGPGFFHTKKPVKTLDDLKGMKIRASGLGAKIVSALGAAPVGATMPETYDALRTGVVDGSMSPDEALQGWKWGEVINYTTYNLRSTCSVAFFVVMNKSKWNSLSPDIQKIFDKVNAEWTDKQAALWVEIDKEGKEFAKQKGVKFIQLSPEEDARWAQKVRPLLDDYVKNSNAKGLPGAEALKFCLDFLKANP